MERQVLMLNASNYQQSLVYPYAFVQVTEVADRFGVNVIRKDLINLKKKEWKSYLSKILVKFNFDMLLITLRNTDALGVDRYITLETDRGYRLREDELYYPIEDTKFLVSILREISNAPIVVGGFGFSVIPEKLMSHLQPDFGVFSGPDGFFENYENVIKQIDLDKIPNLLYFENNEVKKGPVKFYPPASRPEYTDEIIKELKEFGNSDPITFGQIAVEVTRGCIWKCRFCSEPIVKGYNVQYRDLDVLDKEIRFIASNELYQLFLICSEMNSVDNKFIMKFADVVKRINDSGEFSEIVTWKSSYLMNLTKEELNHIYEGGFRGGWYDVISFDDNNIREMKGPFKTSSYIKSIIDTKEIYRDRVIYNDSTIPTPQQRMIARLNEIPSKSTEISFFLGNTHATLVTIRDTLRIFDENKLIELFDSCYLNQNTRVFDYQNLSQEYLEYTVTAHKEKGIIDYNEIYPSFTYSKELIEYFGDPQELIDFLNYINQCYLSSKYRYNRDWIQFINDNTTPKQLREWTSSINPKEFPSKQYQFISDFDLLFSPQDNMKTDVQIFLSEFLEKLILHKEEDVTQFLEILGYESTLRELLTETPYAISNLFYKKFQSLSELHDKLETNELMLFFMNYILYKNGIKVNSKYRTFFVY